MTRRLGIWMVATAFFIGIAALGAILFRGSSRVDPMVGQAAPVISLETLARESARVPTEGYTLLNFWGTWCTPCLAEHPMLMQMADNGMTVVGVAYRDNPERIKAYLERAGDPFSTLYLDPKGEAMIQYGARGVPESFLIDENGVVLARISGAIVPDNFKSDIAPLLRP